MSQGAAPLALGYALLGFQPVAASGCFEVTLDDGKRHGRERRAVTLNRSLQSLRVPPGMRAADGGFSSGSICLVLASRPYCEGDCIRSCVDFLRYVGVRG